MSTFDLSVPEANVDDILQYLGMRGIAFQRNATNGSVTISVDRSRAEELKAIASDMALAHGLINELKTRPHKEGGVML